MAREQVAAARQYGQRQRHTQPFAHENFRPAHDFPGGLNPC
jgi:hypothetical protein